LYLEIVADSEEGCVIDQIFLGNCDVCFMYDFVLYDVYVALSWL